MYIILIASSFPYIPVLSHLLVGGNQTRHLLPPLVHLEQVLSRRKAYRIILLFSITQTDAYWEVDTVWILKNFGPIGQTNIANMQTMHVHP